MNTSLKSNQTGIIHHLGLILLSIVVLGGIGGAGYYVYQTNQGDTSTVVSQETIVDANDDADGEVLPPSDNTPDTQADVQGQASDTAN